MQNGFLKHLAEALEVSDPNSEIRFEKVDFKFLIENYFAHIAQCLMSSVEPQKRGENLLIHLLKDSYERVKRPYGHTSVYSVALLAMIEASERGRVIEMSEIHKFVSRIRAERSEQGESDQILMGKTFTFSGGADLDWMFMTIDTVQLEELLSKTTTKA
jgi:hypothetical protein